MHRSHTLQQYDNVLMDIKPISLLYPQSMSLLRLGEYYMGKVMSSLLITYSTGISSSIQIRKIYPRLKRVLVKDVRSTGFSLSRKMIKLNRRRKAH